MPIVIKRVGDGKPQVEGAMTPEQRKLLWEQIVKNYADTHKDELRKKDA